MHMYFKICSKYSSRTSHQCYIAMAIVTDRKRIFIWSCLFLPKKLGLPHFLQGRVGIPALVPAYCLWAFLPCPFHRPFECVISSWMNRVVPHPLLCLVLLPSTCSNGAFTLGKRENSPWRSLCVPAAPGLWKVAGWAAGIAGRPVSLAREHLRGIFVCWLSTQPGTSLLSEGLPHPLYTHLAAFLPWEGSMESRQNMWCKIWNVRLWALWEAGPALWLQSRLCGHVSFCCCQTAASMSPVVRSHAAGLGSKPLCITAMLEKFLNPSEPISLSVSEG